MKRFIQNYLYEVIIIFIISLLPLTWLRGGEIILGHDANYHINHVERMISSTFSWNDMSYYGRDWTYDRGYLPVNLIQLLLLKLTPSFSSMQSIFFVFLFLVIGLSIYSLALAVFPKIKYRPFRLIAAVGAMFNFFILQGWFTADTGRFLIFAGLPLYILVIHNLFTRVWSQRKSYIIFAALSFFFNGNGLPPLVGFQAIAVGLVGVFYAVFCIRSYQWRGVWFSIKAAFMFICIFALVNMYWLLPIMNFTSVSYGSDYSTFGGADGTLAWERVISKYASFINLFRMQGLADWYDNPVHAYASPYISKPFLIFLSFIPIVMICIGFLVNPMKKLLVEQKRLLLFLSTFLIFGLFMSAGTHPPFGKMYELFMRYIPGFVIFRSSLYKFGFALWIPMILLFGYFMGEFVNKVKNNFYKSIAVTVLIVGIIGFHYSYFFPEQIFHFNQYFKTRFVLPPYVTDMMTYVDKEVPLSSRILLLPELDREYIGVPMDAYSWGYYSMILLPNFISNHTYVADKESDTIIQMIYRSIYSGDVINFNRLVRKTGISHILFRRDVQLSPGSEKAHPIVEVEKKLQSTPSIVLDRQFGNWLLYAISTSRDIPMVSTLHSFDIVSGSTTNDTYLMARDTSDNHGVVKVFSEEANLTLKQLAAKQIMEAECYFCKKDEYIQLVKGITLPKKKTIPTFIASWMSARKEKQNLAATAHSPKERIDVDLSLSQQQLATLLTNPNQLSKGRFQSDLSDSMEQLGHLTGRDRNIYAIRMKAYFESQLRTIAGNPNFQKEANILTKNIEELEKESWYTGDIAYLRFGFTITTPGMYSFYIPDVHLYANQVLLDAVFVSASHPMYLTEGFHTVELHRVNMDTSIFNGPPALFIEQSFIGKTLSIPKLTYTKINPTRYVIHVSQATEPFLLQLNQQYDPRWKASSISDANHVEINGYANGWYVYSQGDFDIVLDYAPQRIFYIGLGVSSVAIVILITLIGFSMIKKKTYEKK